MLEIQAGLWQSLEMALDCPVRGAVTVKSNTFSADQRRADRGEREAGRARPDPERT